MDRGCPFKCTFCDWGSLIAQKMIKFDEPRLFKEFEWISRNKINYLWFTNSNLGIFKERDYNIIDKAVGYHEATGYPKKIAHSGYAKTPPSKNSSLQIQQRLLDGVKDNNTVPRVALQSTNPEVLSNIKRKNMSIVNADKMDSTNKEIELIYPLPGITYDGWVDELSALMPIKKLKINVYPCLILPNAELNEKSYKERFKIKTKIIPFNVDMEECEIITSLKSMSYEDVVKGWMFAWIVMNFWFEPILKYIYYEYFKNEVTVKDFFVKFQDFLEYDSMPTIGILYNQLKNNIHNKYDDYDRVIDHNYSIEYFRQHIKLVLKDIENFISIYFNKHIDNLGVGYGMQ
jgi:ribosomal protein L39E